MTTACRGSEPMSYRSSPPPPLRAAAVSSAGRMKLISCAPGDVGHAALSRGHSAGADARLEALVEVVVAVDDQLDAVLHRIRAVFSISIRHKCE